MKKKIIKLYWDLDFKRKGKIRNNNDRIYYVIRRRPPGNGFFSNWFYVLGHVIYAEENGYIPIVDMKKYKTLYSEHKEDNLWYLFFENAYDTPELDLIYKKENYILSKDTYLYEYVNKYCDVKYAFPSSAAVDYYHPIAKKISMLKNDLFDVIHREIEAFDFQKHVVLGVHYRGTDMKNVKLKGHLPTAAIECYTEKIKMLCEKYNEIDAIYIASDEKPSIDFIENLFANKKKVLYSESIRSIKDGEVGIHFSHNKGYELAQNVIRDAYILSKCDFLICGYSNVAKAAIIMNNNKYREVVVCGE